MAIKKREPVPAPAPAPKRARTKPATPPAPRAAKTKSEPKKADPDKPVRRKSPAKRATATPAAEKPLRILMVASEAHPFAKTGGLAEVAAALPEALGRLGHQVT